MTVSSSIRKAGPFSGNATATVFPFTFKVFDKTDVKVLLVNSLGASTQLTLDSDYSVTLNANQNGNPGGSITYPVSGSPMPIGYSLVMLGDLAYDQETDITNGGGFYPNVIEDMVDKATIQIQQLEEITSRALVITEAESISPVLPNAAGRANSVLGFDALGNPTMLGMPAAIGAGDIRVDTFISDILPNPLGLPTFTAGVTTSLPLSRAPGSIPNTQTHFDASYQGPDQVASLVASTITYTAPIPVGVSRVYVQSGTSLSTSIPAQGSVTDSSVASGTRLYDRIYGIKIDARDYGVVADGVADDTVAAQAAINAAGIGGWVNFPIGTLLLSATLNLLTDQTISGVGPHSTKFQRTGDFGDTVSKPAAAGALHIEGIFFNHGTWYTTGDTALDHLATHGAHINIGGGNQASIENCWIFRMPYGIRLDGCALTNIDNCAIQGVWDPAYAACQEGIADIFLDNTITYSQIIKITRNYLNGAKSAARNITYTASDGTLTVNRSQNIGAKYGILVFGCEDLLVANNFIGAQYLGGLFTNLAAGTANLDWRIIGNFFDDPPSANPSIYFNTQSAATLNGVLIAGNVFNGESVGLNAITAFNGFSPGTQFLSNFSITGNTFHAYVGGCINLYVGSNGTITGNTLTGYNCLNVSPGADATFAAAIALVGTSEFVHAHGNTCGGQINSSLPGGFTYQGVNNSSSNAGTNSVHDNMYVGIGLSVNQTGLVENVPTQLITPGNYTAAPSDRVVVARASQAGAWQFMLPVNPPPGRTITLKDGARTAATFNVQVVGTVDGAANPIYSVNGFSRTFYFNGIEWNVIASA